MFAHTPSDWGHGAVGNFYKGNFYVFVAHRAFFFLIDRSRDISGFSRLGSTSTCFFFFVSSERFAPSRGSSLCCRSYASLPLTAVCSSELSAFTPDDIRVDNTCNTRLVFRRPVAAEQQLYRPPVRSHALDTAGTPAHPSRSVGVRRGRKSELKTETGFFEGKSLELKQRERSADTDRALFFTVKGLLRHPVAALMISHVATCCFFSPSFSF